MRRFKVWVFLAFVIFPFTQLKADHYWYVNSLSLIESPANSGMYRVDYTYTVNNLTVDRFYWEIYVVEAGCNSSDGFTRSFSGCTVLERRDGNYTGTLADGILLCNGKSYDAVMYTRRRGDCNNFSNDGVTDCTNDAFCNNNCGCPEDRAAAARPLGLLTKYPGIKAGDPANIWDGAPLDALGDTPTFDGNWGYIRTTLAGNGLPDYNFDVDITINDCLGNYDQSFSASEADGQMINENFGGATAFVKCGDDISITYTATNTCGMNYPGNTFEVIDNSTFGGSGIGSADIDGPSGPGINVDGRFESLSAAMSFSNICQDGTLDLTLINSQCSAENVTNVNVTYDIEVTYPTSNFTQPTRVNCSDACGQNIVIAGANQWNSTGLNMGTSTTIEPTEKGEFNFDWSGQICTPSITPVDCDSGTGTVLVDNCASCGIYDITYAITNDSCSTCSTTTTKQIEIISPVISNVQGAITDCGEIIPSLSFEVVECNPANGAATATPYTGTGDKRWERSDMPGVYLTEANVGVVAVGQTVTFTPHFRNNTCESCNAIGTPVTIVSLGELAVTCPAVTDLGDFDCSNLNTIPPLPTNELSAESAPYNIVIGDDPCGTIVVLAEDDMVPNACTPTIQTITRTVTIIDDEDGSGTVTNGESSAVCTFTFDIIPAFVSPVLQNVPPTITVSCDVSPTPTTLSYTNGGTAACLSTGSVTSTLTAHPGFCGGTITEVWTIPAFANCDRGDIVVSRVINVDPAPAPSITCPADITIPLGENCELDLSGAGVATATGNCSDDIAISFTDVNTLTSCSGTGTITRTWTATNDCGTMSTCVQTITVVDETSPTISIDAAMVTVSCDMVPPLPVVTASDNCPNFVVTLRQDTITSKCPGDLEILRTWIITDACGNQDSTKQQVIVFDETSPTVVSGPGDVTISCEEAIPDPELPTFGDNCTAFEIVFEEMMISEVTTLGPCDDKFTITRTWTAIDSCGNMTSVSQNIFVVDETAPEIACPADLTISRGADCSLDLSSAGVATATDNCDADVELSFTDNDAGLTGCSQTGVISRTWVAVDNCGNMDSCVQLITIVDDTAPMITCPADITVQLGANCALDLSGVGVATATDNCTNSPMIGFTDDVTGLTACNGTGIILRTWTAQDDCGNQVSCVQTITVEDNIDPVITCPADITVNMDESCTPELSLVGMATATDNCDSAPLITFVDDVSGLASCLGTGTILRTWTATDACDNSVSCVQTITVVDVTPPTIVCPSVVTVAYDASCSLDLTPAAQPLVSDNCDTNIDIKYVDDDSGLTACNGTGTIIRTWTATDACGNASTCTQEILIVDTSPPSITCSPDVQVSMTAACIPDTVGLAVPTIMDNCTASTVLSYVDDHSGLSACSGTGVITRTWTVVDDCGNMNTCMQVITVVDDTPPVITCPADLTVYQQPNACGVDFTGAGVATATDNCDIDVVITFRDDASGRTGCSMTGDILRTWRAVDDCGNVSTCVQVITVADQTAPTITGVTDLTVSCFDNAEAMFNQWVSNHAEGTAIDNCGAVTWSTTPAVPVFVPNTEICITFSATDECGHVTSENACFNMDCLEIEKGPPSNADNDMSGDISAGDVLTYTVVTTNTGSTSLNNVVVNDPLIAPSSETCLTLAPTLSCTLIGTYTVTASDIISGRIYNEATVSTDELDDLMDDELVILNEPLMDIQKSFVSNADGDGSQDISVGDVLTYKIVVENTGSANLTDVLITDSKLTDPTEMCSLVVPGDSCKLVGTYIVMESDLAAGQITNLASAESDQTDEITDQVVIPLAQPELDVVKSSPELVFDGDGSLDMSAGDSIEYTITVTNTGTSNLTNVIVMDPLLTPSMITCGLVLPGGSCVLMGRYEISDFDIAEGMIINEASANSDQTDELTDEVIVNLNEPDIDIVKSSPVLSDLDNNLEVSENDVLSYSITVTNTGTANLTNVIVSDNLIMPMTTSCDLLLPGESCVLDGTYTVTMGDVGNEIKNTATASSDQTDTVMDEVSLGVPTPSMNVIKSNAVLTNDADGSGDMSVGDELSYSIVLTNNGDANLPDVEINDALLTPSNKACGLLAPGESCELIGTYIIQDSDVAAGEIENIALGSSSIVPPVMDSDTTVTELGMPSLGIVKSNAVLLTDTDMSTDISVGDVLQYTIVATNNGSSNLTDVIVNDPLLSPDAESCDLVLVGANCTLTGTYTVTTADLARGMIKNTATTNSTQSQVVMDMNMVTLPVPEMDIEKTYISNNDADGSLDISAGDLLTYEVVVSNTGDAYLTDVIIEDAKLTPSTTTCVSVAPGTSCVLTGTYLVSQADVIAGKIDNIAIASSDQTDDIAATETVPLLSPSFAIEKNYLSNSDPDGSLDISVGDVLTYEVVVTNDGTANLTDVLVSDDLIMPNQATCALLTPGASCVLTGMLTVTEEQVTAGQIINTAIANTDQTEEQETDETVPVPTPSLAITKDVPLLLDQDNDDSGDMSAGDVIIYKITVTNNGTSNLTNVTVEDDLITPDSSYCALLEPGEDCVLTGTYLITETDVENGTIMNMAVAESDQTEVIEDEVEQILPQPSMDLTKNLVSYEDKDMSGDISVGDELIYDVVMTNNGSATLTDIVIKDPLLTPDSMHCTLINVGFTCTLTGSYIVQENDLDMELTNVAVATSDQTDPVQAEVNIEVPAPSLVVIKEPAFLKIDTDDSGDISVGDTLEYTITLTNNGNANLPNTIISDPLLTPSSVNCGLLLPTQSCQLVGYYVVTPADVIAGQIENIATGLSDLVPPVMDMDTSTTLIGTPSLAIVKSAPILSMDTDLSTDISAGDLLTYSILVTNNGSSNLTNVIVSDPMLTPDSTVCKLLVPGSNCLLTGTYTVTQDDVLNGLIENIATGSSLQSEDVKDTVEVILASPAFIIEKELSSNADGDGSVDISVDDILTYTITVTNTGDAFLTDVIVSDPMLSPNQKTCALIAPNETCVLTGTYQVDAADVINGTIMNEANAISDQTDEIMAEHEVAVPRPELDIAKRIILNEDGDGSGDISDGDILTYQITVTNVGTANLTEVTVSDPLINPDEKVCAILTPSQTCTLTGTYEVSAIDVTSGMIINTATGSSAQSDDEEIILETPLPMPSLSIIKNAPTLLEDMDGSEDFSSGDIISYTITATNTGTANLTNVLIQDTSLPLTPSSSSCTLLLPGEVCTLVGTYVLTDADIIAGFVKNTATAESDQTDVVRDIVSEDLPQPSLAIKKSFPTYADVDLNNQISLGDTLFYSILVTNNGTANLTNVAIIDDLIIPTGGTTPCALLMAGETCTLLGYSIVDVNGTQIDNTATAVSDQTDPVSDEVSVNVDEASINISKGAPILKVDTDGSGDISEGDVIEYTITVVNNGNQTLTDVMISDQNLMPDQELCGVGAPRLFNPGETCILIGEYTVQPEDVIAGQIKNVSTVESNNPPFIEMDSVTITLPQPSMDMVKSSPLLSMDLDGSGDVSVGDILQYTITITNTGTASLTDVYIEDVLITPMMKTCDIVLPGDQCILVGSYEVQPEDIGVEIKNLATGGSQQTEPIQDSTTIITPVPDMSILKSDPILSNDLDNNGIMTAGDSLQYVIVVTNTGSANLTDVVITDPNLISSSKTCTLLLPGATCTLIGKYALTQENIDSAYYENVAIATSTQAEEVKDTVVTDLPFIPELMIEKSVSDPSISLGGNITFTDAGDTLLYTYEVTNIGTVTMYEIEVIDAGPSFNGSNGTGSLSTIVCDNSTLLPGESTSCRAVYILSRRDVINAAGFIDGVKNIATSIATDPLGEEYESDMDMALTTIIESPMIELRKEAIAPLTDTNGDGIIWIGDEVQYVFTVINTGNTALDNISIDDTKISDAITCELTALNPGQSTTCTGAYIITESDASNGEIINTAMVSGASPVGTVASDISDDPNDPTTATSDPTVVELPCPSLVCIAFINLTLPSTGVAAITSESLGYAPGLILELTDENGNVIPDNMLTCEHAGQKLIYRIIHPCSPSGCWGEINVETKSVPTHNETIIETMCGAEVPELMSLDEVLDSIQNKGCYVELNDLFENTATQGDQCTGFTTIRKVYGKYQIHKVSNQVLLQVDTIRIMPLDTAMVLCPAAEVVLSCNAVDEYPTADYIDSIMGIQYAYPYIDKGQVVDSVLRVDTLEKDSIYTEMVEVSPGLWTLLEVIDHYKMDSAYYVYDTSDVLIAIGDSSFCNLSVKYTDQTLENCLGEYAKIFRTWTIIDWCSKDIKTCDQWILTKDLKGPSIVPLKDKVVSVEPWTCEGLVHLDIETEENCSPISEVVWTASTGQISNGNVLSGIGMSDSPIEVRVAVIDKCDQVTRDTFLLTIVDGIAPVAVSVDTLNISLTGVSSDHVLIDQGIAKVMTEAFDQGSYDSGCGDISTCVLLQSELDSPIIRDDIHLRNAEGLLMYIPQQCVPHGIYEYKYLSNKDTLTEKIEYVTCAPFVKFCCSDIGSEKVALVVSDTSSYSLDATAWSIVNIEDKSSPVVYCEDVDLTCGSDYSVLTLGEPEWYSTYCGDNQIYNIDQGAIDQCGEGTIERRWYVDSVYACSQFIHLTSGVRFNPYSIKWPKHYDGTPYGGVRRECEEDVVDKDGEKSYIINEYPKTLDMGDALECEGDILMIPTWCNADCGLIAMTHEDIEVKTSDACKKIIRRWTVIDWCTYSPNDPITDNGGNEFQAVDDTWMGEGWWNPNAKKGENCTTCDHPSASSDPIYFRYSEVEMDGFYVFDQIIKIIDKTPPTIEVAQEVTVNILDGATSKTDGFAFCRGSADVVATVSDFCGGNNLDISHAQWWIEVKNSSDEIIETYSLQGDTITVRTPEGGVDDVYFIDWQVSDPCGNKVSQITKVVYIDTKAPTPVCIQAISTAAMSTDGSVQIWASDFDAGSFDNCSEVELLFLDPATDSLGPSLTLTCADLVNGQSSVLELNIYVRDAAGNIDFCTVELNVNDERDICPDEPNVAVATISGKVYTDSGVMIEDVEVSLNTSNKEVTSVDGVYAFDKNPMYQSYDISAYRGDHPLNGVTSLDLVLIQKHILGIQGLLTPYQLIAADINGDQKVTAADLVELRRLILGVQTDFSNNHSWRFVSAQNAPDKMEFTWPFTESIFISSLDVNRMEEDFVGVKIGDVSGNAVANSIQSRSNSSRNMTLHSPSVMHASDDIIEIPIYTKSIASITALQLTLEHSVGELINIVPGEIEVSSEQLATMNDDVSTIVWHDATGVDLAEEARLFSLWFKNPSDEVLNVDGFNINSTVTEAKAYDKEANEYSINWEWSNLHSGEVSFELFQNEPNPFLNNSTVKFALPRDGEATLTFFDVTGRVLDIVVDHYSKGYHKVQIERNQFDHSGVIYYQLESGDNTAIKKMIILE